MNNLADNFTEKGKKKYFTPLPSKSRKRPSATEEVNKSETPKARMTRAKSMAPAREILDAPEPEIEEPQPELNKSVSAKKGKAKQKESAEPSAKKKAVEFAQKGLLVSVKMMFQTKCEFSKNLWHSI